MHRDTPRQLEMVFERPERSPEELRAELLRHGGRLAELTLTRNRVSMVSVRFDAAGGARVRMHVVFLGAPEAVITALGRYLVKRSRHEWLVVKAYVAGMGRRGSADHGLRNAVLGRDGSPNRPEQAGGGGRLGEPSLPGGTYGGGRTVAPLKAKGRVYDLGVIFESVNRRYFSGKVVCGIGWGRRGKAKRGARSRMIRFGSYNRMDNVIRVNPVLDDDGIEAGFVEYIVFHEMLHAAMPSVAHGVRSVHHHRAYRMLERRFPGHARMQKLAVELVGRLRGGRG